MPEEKLSEAYSAIILMSLDFKLRIALNMKMKNFQLIY